MAGLGLAAGCQGHFLTPRTRRQDWKRGLELNIPTAGNFSGLQREELLRGLSPESPVPRVTQPQGVYVSLLPSAPSVLVGVAAVGAEEQEKGADASPVGLRTLRESEPALRRLCRPSGQGAVGRQGQRRGPGWPRTSPDTVSFALKAAQETLFTVECQVAQENSY